MGRKPGLGWERSLRALPVRYIASWHVLARGAAHVLMHRLPKKQGLAILDVGVGGGMGSIVCAMNGHTVVSLDISTFPLALLKRTSLQTELAARIHPLQGDATNLPLGEGCFDVVIASHIIEHLAAPEALLSELSRVLKRGGVLLLSMPSGYEPARPSKCLGLNLDDVTHVVPGYSHQDIANMLPPSLKLQGFEYTVGPVGFTIHDAQTLLGRVFDIRANPQRPPRHLDERIDGSRTRVCDRLLWLFRESAVRVLLGVVRIENRFFREKGMLLDCVIGKE